MDGLKSKGGQEGTVKAVAEALLMANYTFSKYLSDAKKEKTKTTEA